MIDPMAVYVCVKCRKVHRPKHVILRGILAHCPACGGLVFRESLDRRR